MESDFAGLHTQHAGAGTSFNFTLQIVIAIETIPWIAAGALIQQKSMDLSALLKPGPFMIALLFTALLGTVGYMILVHNRLLINFYARCLNYYRTLLVANDVPMGKLPVNPEFPRDSDQQGIMLLLALTFATLNGIYFALIAYEVVKLIIRGAMHVPQKAQTYEWIYWVAALAALLLFGFYYRVVTNWRGVATGSRQTPPAR
jgi:uncharacterized BrkB/YihY/UPF0761 family membrane protein